RGVVLGAGLAVVLRRAYALLLLRFAGAFLGLALCPGLGHRASASPCARCGGRTSGRTCAARSGRASFAATCWSDSCAACSLRKPASPRCGHLREPFLLVPYGSSYKRKPRAEARGRPEG